MAETNTRNTNTNTNTNTRNTNTIPLNKYAKLLQQYKEHNFPQALIQEDKAWVRWKAQIQDKKIRSLARQTPNSKDIPLVNPKLRKDIKNPAHKITKIPAVPSIAPHTNGNICKNWQNNSTSYAEVTTAPNKESYPGVGFNLTINHSFLVIDIDDMTSDTNKDLIEAINTSTTYTEWSPSGLGVHIWLRVPLNEKAALLKSFKRCILNPTEHRDLFIAKGYVTMTGDKYSNSPATIREMPAAQVEALLKPFFSTARPPHVEPSPLAKWEQQVQKQKYMPVKRIAALLDEIDVKTLTSTTFAVPGQPEKLDPHETEEAREPWMTICQAVHHNCHILSNKPKDSEAGYAALSLWSSKGNKYDPESLRALWESCGSVEEDNPVTLATLIALVEAQRPVFVHFNQNKVPRPLAEPENARILFKHYGYEFKYDILSDTTSIKIPKRHVGRSTRPGKDTLDTLDEQVQHMRGEFTKAYFTPHRDTFVRQAIIEYAHGFPYNHPQDYFNRIEHLAEDTIQCKEDVFSGLVQELADTIILNPHTTTQEHEDLKAVYLATWLVQLCHAVTNDPDNTGAHKDAFPLNKCLILTGPQAAGKTVWFNNLLANTDLYSRVKTGAKLKLDAEGNADAKQEQRMRPYLMVSVDEIDKLTMKSPALLKSWLDTITAEVTLLYTHDSTKITRRAMLGGSSNLPNLLTDTTGNRRFFVMDVISLDIEALKAINMDKLLSQIWYAHKHFGFNNSLHALGEKGRAAIRLRDVDNAVRTHTFDDTVVDELNEVFDTDGDYEKEEYKPYTLKMVKDLIPSFYSIRTNGSSTASKAIKEGLAHWLKTSTAHGSVEPAKYKNGIVKTGSNKSSVYMMPPKRETAPIEAFSNVVTMRKKRKKKNS